MDPANDTLDPAAHAHADMMDAACASESGDGAADFEPAPPPPSMEASSGGGSSSTLAPLAPISAPAAAAAAAPAAPVVLKPIILRGSIGMANTAQGRSFVWEGNWASNELDVITSAFWYAFQIPATYIFPIHTTDAVVNKNLPSSADIKVHKPLVTSMKGHYFLKSYANGQVAGETRYDEPPPRTAQLSLTIGGPVLPNAARPTGVPDDQLIGLSIKGANLIGKFHMVGSYQPTTGTAWAYKIYMVNQNAMRKPALPIRPPSTPSSVPATRKRRDATDALLDEAAATTAAPRPVTFPPAHPEFKVPVSKEVEALLEVYTAIRNSKYCPTWFIKPVDAALVPGYYDVIKEPMCLDEVERKLVNGLYAGAADFQADMMRVWRNAQTFNPPGSEVYQDSTYYEKEFHKEMQAYHSKLHKARQAEQKRREKEEMDARRRAEQEEAQRRRALEARMKAAAAAAAPSMSSSMPGMPAFDGAASSESTDVESRKRKASQMSGGGRRLVDDDDSDASRSDDDSMVSGGSKRKRARRTKDTAEKDLRGQIAQLKQIVESQSQTMQMFLEAQTKQMQAVSAGVMPGIGMSPVMPGMLQPPAFQPPRASMGGASKAKKAKPVASASKVYADDDDYISGGDFDDDDEDYGRKKKAKKSSGTRSRPAAPAASSMRAAEPEPLTLAEKQRLTEDVSQLSESDTARVLQIIQEHGVAANVTDGEVELDINSLPTPTLRALQRFVAERLGMPLPPGAARRQTLQAEARAVEEENFRRLQSRPSGSGFGSDDIPPPPPTF